MPTQFAQKHESALIKATNLRKEDIRKKQKVVDKQKADTMAEKQRKEKKGYSLFIKDDGYNDSEIFGTDSNEEDGFSNLEDD